MVSLWTTTWLMRGPVSKRWMVMLVLQICAVDHLARRPVIRHCVLTMATMATMAVTALRHRLGRGASGIASGKQAAAEEGAFQRAIAMHAATAEAGCFAGGVKS